MSNFNDREYAELLETIEAITKHHHELLRIALEPYRDRLRELEAARLQRPLVVVDAD